jgi:hypothetical protein
MTRSAEAALQARYKEHGTQNIWFCAPIPSGTYSIPDSRSRIVITSMVPAILIADLAYWRYDSLVVRFVL